MRYVILRNDNEGRRFRVWQGGAFICVPADEMEQAEPWGLDVAGEMEFTPPQQDAGKKARAVGEPKPSPED